MTETEAEIDNALKLVGYTVVGLSQDGEFWGLTLRRRGKKELVAWVLCDPEGNGPGHLEIE